MIDNGNGTITDEATGLMWQKGTPPPMNWRDSIKYCSTGALGGYTDWRMPTIQELKSLVDHNRFNPAINTEYFPDTVSSFYWSSTTYDVNTSYAWGVPFYYGYVTHAQKANRYYVKAVREVYRVAKTPEKHR